MPRIFISHAWEDSQLVRRLENELQAAGAEVWVDHSGIRGGDNLPKRINAALEWCDVFLLVWSKTASKSPWVNLEWTSAVALKKPIIPCLLDDSQLPFILVGMHYLDFRNLDRGIVQLLRALKLTKQSMVPAAAKPIE
ncbi:MAG: toll/interleukin-1 receptor domain-containing protein [candidate division KSB1 bacterium]|nr:toll/interleukin-1 receptor domain-containing protein [candidate division KSB1 bacterium]